MKHAARRCKTLAVSEELQAALLGACTVVHFHAEEALFRAANPNKGVFLVRRGAVCLQVPDVSKLDRVFFAGSVLGLPSTFTGKPYSLTAKCLKDCDVAFVDQKSFLTLMKSRPELCREATDVLGREVAYILSAFSGRRRRLKADRHQSPEIPDKAAVC